MRDTPRLTPLRIRSCVLLQIITFHIYLAVFVWQILVEWRRASWQIMGHLFVRKKEEDGEEET